MAIDDRARSESEPVPRSQRLAPGTVDRGASPPGDEFPSTQKRDGVFFFPCHRHATCDNYREIRDERLQRLGATLFWREAGRNGLWRLRFLRSAPSPLRSGTVSTGVDEIEFVTSLSRIRIRERGIPLGLATSTEGPPRSSLPPVVRWSGNDAHGVHRLGIVDRTSGAGPRWQQVGAGAFAGLVSAVAAPPGRGTASQSALGEARRLGSGSGVPVSGRGSDFQVRRAKSGRVPGLAGVHSGSSRATGAAVLGRAEAGLQAGADTARSPERGRWSLPPVRRRSSIDSRGGRTASG